MSRASTTSRLVIAAAILQPTTIRLWAFFSDADGSFEFSRYRADVPPEVEEWFQAEARRRLPPVPDAEPLSWPTDLSENENPGRAERPS